MKILKNEGRSMEKTEIEVLKRGDGYCVCIKPAGVPSQGEEAGDMPALLAAALGVDRVYPVHRLDRETQGLMVYATDSESAAELSRQISSGELIKEYIACLVGNLTEDSGELVDLLFFDRKRGRSFVVDRQRKGVKNVAYPTKLAMESAIRDAVLHHKCPTDKA
jgi:23S rRNA-/tRNA-specific pseudouridylate synthase